MQNKAEKGRQLSASTVAYQTFSTNTQQCSGAPPPCDACVASQTECTFREDLDGRRKEALKRKVEDADNHRDLLSGLLKSIRWSDEGDAQHLFRLIRDDAPLSAVHAFIDETVNKLRERSPWTDETIDGLLSLKAEASNLQEEVPWTRPRRKAMSIEQMVSRPQCRVRPFKIPNSILSSSGKTSADMGLPRNQSDEPMYHLTAKPWTTVTNDDFLISHLTSLYFTWWNALFHPLHEAAFIEAMEQGDITNPLCSPFLVNALLALACAHSDLPMAFSDSDDPDTWGEHFYEEAKRLWDREEGHASMTNVQGLCLLLLYQTMHGKDQIGWSSLSVIVQLYQDLGLSHQVKLPRDCSPAFADQMRTAMLNVSWSIFSINT